MNHGFKLHDFIAIMPDNSNAIISVPILQKPDGTLYCIGIEEDELFIDYIADDARVIAEYNSYTVCLLPNPSAEIIRTIYSDKKTDSSNSIDAFKYAVYRYLQETGKPIYCYTSNDNSYPREIIYNNEELIVAYSDPGCAFLAVREGSEIPHKRLLTNEDFNYYDYDGRCFERMHVIPNPEIHPDFYEQYPHLLEQALSCHTNYKELL